MALYCTVLQALELVPNDKMCLVTMYKTLQLNCSTLYYFTFTFHCRM